jgi:hypothetical protein
LLMQWRGLGADAESGIGIPIYSLDK